MCYNKIKKELNKRKRVVLVHLTEYQYTLCDMFSKESAKTQRQIEFGSKETAPRDIKEISRDNMIGKMAEAAVSTFIREEFGKCIPVNYEIYSRGQYDENDITINGWEIDVKATRKGQYLLLEKSKVDFRIKEHNLPDAIIMCKVPWNEEEDLPKCRAVDIVGCVSIKKLLHSKSGILRIKKGDCIPGTKCVLQADNYVIHFDDLTDIKKSAKYMIKSPK